MDRLSPVSGLVGALVGAGLSYLATHRAEAKRRPTATKRALKPSRTKP
ncbi:hypothetical protein PV396_06880 [Streptomyces sp. ME02-8801-2C]|nr:hypothetical protein [Streptomyces sp. ME02-8801-2C]MDX3451682.1 hypothetical protein [Streptomyces sp. ME02-8801-2C]